MAKGDGKYRWGGGKKVHNISQGDHDKHVLAQKTLGTQDLTAPPSASQAITEANSAADLQYGPQVQAARQQQANVQPFFTDYLARVAGYARAAQAQMAPVLQQAQAYQTGADTQAPPGLDPNSAAGQQAAQAAQGRGALAQLGNDALNTNAQATQDYFGGQQALAARVQPQLQAEWGQKLANAESQRGAKVNEFLTGARQNAQNFAIARGTLLNSATNNEADAANAAANREQAAADKAASRAVTKRGQDISAANKQATQDSAAAKPNKYGIPASQWDHWSTSHRQRVIDAFDKKNAKGTTDPNHASDIHAATGKVKNQITDVDNFQQTLIGQETDDTSKPQVKNKQTGKFEYPPRKVTQADVDKMKIAKYGMLARIAIAIREGRTLDRTAIDYLKNLDQNFRVPREWLPSGYGKGGRAAGDTGPPSGRGD